MSQCAYHLLASRGDKRVADIMRDTVVVIDPMQNPDGRDRFIHHFEMAEGLVPDSDRISAEHNEPWPGGRTNHYLFDMNRDWFTMNQPESARSREIAAWLPQLLVDSHEMGANATYLFPPPRHPFNPHLPPNARKWERPFSDDQAKALDGRGYPYFTGEWNEEFFPGYGSSWVSYHGAVGILYEMSRTSGTLVRKRSGTVRTFAQAIEHQTTSSVANLTSLAAGAAASRGSEISPDQLYRSAYEDYMRGNYDLAAQGLGLVTVPIFPNDRAENVGYILQHAGVRIFLIEGSKQWDALKEIQDQLAGLTRIISLEPVESAAPVGPRVTLAKEWLPAEASEQDLQHVDPDKLATIVYTSGTTGRSKGVMLSHRNILCNAEASIRMIDIYTDDLMLSFLPLSHMLERTLGCYLPILAGSRVAFARSVLLLAEDLLSVRPTILISVPRIFERVYAKIQDKLNHDPAIARKLFNN